MGLFFFFFQLGLLKWHLSAAQISREFLKIWDKLVSRGNDFCFKVCTFFFFSGDCFRFFKAWSQLYSPSCLETHLSQPLWCWAYRCAPSHEKVLIMRHGRGVISFERPANPTKDCISQLVSIKPVCWLKLTCPAVVKAPCLLRACCALFLVWLGLECTLNLVLSNTKAFSLTYLEVTCICSQIIC